MAVETRPDLRPIERFDESFWDADPAFRDLMEVALAETGGAWGESLLAEMGEIAAQVIPPLSEDANRNTPELVQYDAQGNRIDEVKEHPSYREMIRIAFTSGLGALFYHEPTRMRHGYVPHALTFGLGYLFAQAEQGLYCPICMTEGAARVIDQHATPELKARFLPRLAAQDVETLLQGAMFLTEKQGGSDVGANTCRAVPEGDHWRLYGDKWFCSNAGDAGVILVLARPEGAQEGTRGLGLFLMPREWEGEQNGFRINRLKDKLGTRSMPSGEFELDGARAYLLGDAGKGFKYMTDMLNVSRVYNAVSSVALMRRAYAEGLKLATERAAFGRTVENFPLMRQGLVDLAVELEAAIALVFETLRVWDRIDMGGGDDHDQRLLRLMTPQIKYHTGKQAVRFASEACEILGGNGYVETFITPRLLRDAQVLPIWEGTTNILTLDVLRVLHKERGGEALLFGLRGDLAASRHAALAPMRELLGREVERLGAMLEDLGKIGDERVQLHVKTWSDRAIRVHEAVLLLRQAERELNQGRTARKFAILGLHVRKFLTPVAPGAAGWTEDGAAIALYEAIAHHAPLTVGEAQAALGLAR